MNWNYLIKATAYVFGVILLLASGCALIVVIMAYTPMWLFLTLFFGVIIAALIRVQYTHYKRMDEIEADRKKWEAEMDKNWEKISR